MTGLDADDPTAKREALPWLRVPRLLTAGVAIVLAALVSCVGLGLSHFPDYNWSENALVPVDGEQHSVELSSDGPVMLWAYEAFAVPTCTMVDDAAGAELPLRASDGTYRREGGSAGDWVGIATFESPDDSVEVTCAGLDRSSGISVAVEAAPNLPPFFANFGPWMIIPVVMGVVGLFLVALAVLLGALRRGWGFGDR